MSKVQVDKSHYLTLNYLSKRRWNSYWYQINEIYQLKPKKILEIGTGGGVVSNQLKKMGFLVTTVDFDQSLKPDIVGDVRKLPFKNDNFLTSPTISGLSDWSKSTVVTKKPIFFS